ncbi:MAG: iron-sulfur cluster-binding protein [Chloroflexi bacterium RBG_16_57_9]|nr:MAG: iron-sulfur cluster-binding protein [Chloroflexi bacterium RBG_16_57_9]
MAQKAKVWYADANATNWTESLVCKAKDIFYEAKLNECIEKGDSVAIKIHTGERNRTRCLRPELVAAVVEEVKACGGRPFVCDTTTLPYHAYNDRIIASLELEGAARHGFTQASLGCPLVIADGFSGDDDVRVEIPTGVIIKEAYVAAAIAHADAMINLAHAKGHPIASFGGCIKCIGIGGQSKRGKFQEHLAHWGTPEDFLGWPASYPEKCLNVKCEFHKQCMDGCHAGALRIDETGFHRDTEKCWLCYACQVTCIFTGHESQTFTADYFPYAQMAMSDAALAVLLTFEPGKVGHMAYAIDTDTMCDCIPWAGLPVSPDIGVFASKDIVAIDSAILDMIDAAPAYPGGAGKALEAANYKQGADKFAVTVGTPPRYQLTAGVKNGMGVMDYELIKWEPPLTAAQVAKWQVRQTPTALILREMWKKRDYLKEVQPFQRIPFEQKPNIPDYAVADRTPFLKKLPVKEWAEAAGR